MPHANWVAFGVAFFLAAAFFRGDLAGAGAGAGAGALAANRSALALLDAEVCCAKDGSAARRSTCLTSDSSRGWKSAAPVSPTSARNPVATCCRSIGAAAAAVAHGSQSDSDPAPGRQAERVRSCGRRRTCWRGCLDLRLEIVQSICKPPPQEDQAQREPQSMLSGTGDSHHRKPVRHRKAMTLACSGAEGGREGREGERTFEQRVEVVEVAHLVSLRPAQPCSLLSTDGVLRANMICEYEKS